MICHVNANSDDVVSLVVNNQAHYDAHIGIHDGVNGAGPDYDGACEDDDAIEPDGTLGLTATGGDLYVLLDWDEPDDGGSDIIGYRIERESPVGAGFSILVADTGSTDTDYIDANVINGIEYNYRVFAINAIGLGGPSNEDNVIPKGPEDEEDCLPDEDEEEAEESGSATGTGSEEEESGSATGTGSEEEESGSEGSGEGTGSATGTASGEGIGSEEEVHCASGASSGEESASAESAEEESAHDLWTQPGSLRWHEISGRQAFAAWRAQNISADRRLTDS